VSAARFDPVLLDLDGTFARHAGRPGGEHQSRAIRVRHAAARRPRGRAAWSATGACAHRACARPRSHGFSCGGVSAASSSTTKRIAWTAPGLTREWASSSNHWGRVACDSAVVTNSPKRLSRKILAGLGLIAASRRAGRRRTRSPSASPIRAACATCLERCTAQARAALLVGDSTVDVETAKAAGVAMCGVTWGFDPESLAGRGPWISSRTTRTSSVRIIVDGGC